MIVNNFHIQWASSFSKPFEANPPLAIDANAVLALSVPFQRFKTVAGKAARSLSSTARLQAVQLQVGGPFDSRERLYPLAGGKIPLRLSR